MAPGMATEQNEPVVHDGETYLPVKLSALRLDTAPFFSLYFRSGADQPFVLYCRKDTPFNEAARAKLHQNKIRVLYVRERERGRYSRYIADNLEDILNDRRLPVREKAAVLYDSAQAVVGEVLEKPGSRETLKRGKDIVRHTVEFMTSRDFLLEHMLRTISCDYYLYTHSVNVVAYSVALAMRMGTTDTPTLREVANGALFHDVGKKAINQRILKKDGPLTEKEWEEMKTYPLKGYETLAEANCLGEIALDIVLHHQERIDGTGYPHRLSGSEIPPFARIVTIADVFDALTTDQHHRKGLSSFRALSDMSRTLQRQLDGRLLRGFVEMMGGDERR